MQIVLTSVMGLGSRFYILCIILFVRVRTRALNTVILAFSSISTHFSQLHILLINIGFLEKNMIYHLGDSKEIINQKWPIKFNVASQNAGIVQN